MTSPSNTITDDELSNSEEKKSLSYRILNSIKRKKILILILCLLAIITIGMYIRITSSSDAHTVNNKRSDLILKKLNIMNEEIQQLYSHPSGSKESLLAIKSLQQEIGTIQKSIVDLSKSSDIERISNQIVSVKEVVENGMNDIKKSMISSIGNKSYLEASVLPFQVTSVDMIGGHIYVSINYNEHISPLSISDTVSGWKLTGAEYDDNSAEFVNEKNQFVKVNLKG